MVDETHDTRADDDPDGILDKLLRDLPEVEMHADEWPAAEEIVAYISGEANEAQIGRIQNLLADSAEFRRYIVDTASAIQFMATEAGNREFANTRVPSFPYLAPYLKGLKQSAGLTLWERIAHKLPSRVLVPAFVISAAAAIALMMMPSEENPVGFTRWRTLSTEVFVGGTVRGSTDQLAACLGATSDSAAICELRRLIDYDLESGSYKFSARARAERSSSQTISITVIDSTGTELSQLVFDNPYDDEVADVDHLDVWVLALPDFSLWSTSLANKEHRVLLAADEMSRACMVLVLPGSKGYTALPGRVIEQ